MTDEAYVAAGMISLVSARSGASIRGLIWELGRLADVASITPRRHVIKLLWAWMVLIINQRRGISASPGFVLHWNGPNGPIRGAVFDPSEIRVIWEVFVGDEYGLPESASPKSILDLGSNAGMSILYFRNRYPDARIVGVEPSSIAFARLARNTSHLSNVSITQAAAVGTNRTVDLVISEESWASSIHGDRHNARVEHVDGLTVEEILTRTGLEKADVIKIDVEGCEVEILERSVAVRQADWLIFEFHQEHTTGDVWQLIENLPEHEIVRVTGDSRRHPLVTLRRRGPEHTGQARRVDGRSGAAQS